MTDSPICVAAPAKINLYLHVTGKRDDGYHDLDSLVVFADVHDVITVQPASGLELEINGPFGDGLPADPSNLVLKAAETLRAAAGIEDGARITLTKNLPVAAGMGGGSADAAATMKALVRHWNLHPAMHDLSGIALGLGADVPVCLFGRPTYMSGVGDKLEPVHELASCVAVLVNPGVEVPTPAVFAARRGDYSPVWRADSDLGEVDGLADALTATGNDLTRPAIETAPVIGDVLAALESTKDCLIARMTGSGATCFGLYASDAAADRTVRDLADTHAEWWIAATRFQGA